MRAEWKGLNEALAQAYLSAARSGTDMRAATDAFESIRVACASRAASVFNTRAIFLHHIGKAEMTHLVPLLRDLKSRWESEVIGTLCNELRQEFEKSTDAGWKAWLQLYAASFDERAWWKSLGLEIATRALPAAPVPAWPPARVRDMTQRILRGEWTEVFEWFVFLSGQDLRPASRALFTVLCAEIEIYHFRRPAKALELLNQAEKLSRDLVPVRRAWGEYHQLMEDVEKAKEEFQGLIDAHPDLSDGFLGMGECHNTQNQPLLAEATYEQAIAHAPGAYDAHMQLMNWHCKPDWNERRASLVNSLGDRMRALADYQAEALAYKGWALYEAEQYDAARADFSAALEQDSLYVSGVTGLAYCDMLAANSESGERQTELIEAARGRFEKLLSYQHAAPDAYRGLADLEKQKEQWDSALRNYQSAIEHCHEDWQPILHSLAADLLVEQERVEEAQAQIEKSLALAPDAPDVRASLLRLVAKLVANKDEQAARPLLERWRELVGSKGESTYQNNLGHLDYSADNDAEAAEHYRLAAKAAPDDAVLYSNLALALGYCREPGTRLAVLTEAANALVTASRLDPGNSDYLHRRASIQIELRFVQAYGESGLGFDPTVLPIRVELRNTLLPAILDSTESNLSDETMQRIEVLRKRVRGSFGLELPGIRFAPLEDPAEPYTTNYRIQFMEEQPLAGKLREAPDERMLEKIFDAITEQVEANLERLIGYEFAANLLKPQDVGGMGFPRWSDVVRFLRMCRERLRRRSSLEPTDQLIAEFERTQEGGKLAQIAATEQSGRERHLPASAGQG